MSRQVSQSPLFERKKHLTKEEFAVLDDEIRRICAAPEIGEAKKGDLAGVSVHKFKVRERLFLVAYEYDEKEVLLLALGAHENFYRDLKRYLA
ncbi:MAG: type II toxin-antitoxin system RelE/ParE family toxin [Deltaproteobacteria bacterium]|nr:type II toxin-antitoxin system RelE/ParE family toxin [Deltaproteobacteria bacterium]